MRLVPEPASEPVALSPAAASRILRMLAQGDTPVSAASLNVATKTIYASIADKPKAKRR